MRNAEIETAEELLEFLNLNIFEKNLKKRCSAELFARRLF